jgi:hypothetical protein
VDQGGGYEGMGPAFTGEPIGTRMSTPAGRQAELANLANAAGFLTSPFGAMAAYALTGQSPAQIFGVGNQREALGLQQSDVMPQGLMPQGGMSGIFGGVRNFLFGPPQQSVPLGPMAPAIDSRAGISSFQDAYNFGLQYGLGEEASNAAGITAASLVAQGMDPITAVTLATQNAAEMAAYNTPVVGSAMQGAAPQGMPGLSSNAFDLTAPIAAAPAQTFGLGQGSQIESSYDFGGGNVADNSGISYDMSDFGFR